jgi:ABC-type Fe3+ transport system substrate-binding protein
MVALKEVPPLLKLKLLKLPRFAWITITIIAIFAVGIIATGYYYYVIPRQTHLRILYTHSNQMISDVVNSFTDWYKERYGRPIEVTFTPTDPQSAYETVTNLHQNPEAEIWWGGPLSLFEEVSSSLLPYNSTQKSEMNTTCRSCPLMELNQSTPRWYAASLQALGVMYNETSSLKPQTWADLLKEEYKGNLTMVDPTKSEFTQPFIMLMIQSKNWTEGWEYLVRLSASVKDYDDAETTSVLKVASGYLPIAIVPDFYAYNKIQELEKIGIHSLNFTYLDATVLQPDPIAIIKRGKYLEEAKAFVDYILTKQAQSIIGKYCLPVQPNATVIPPRINPFTSNFPSVYNYNKTFEKIGKDIVKDYYKIWITERHDQEPSIKTAWKEIEGANKTSPYYDPAWKNFTMAGYYVNRNQIDTIYNETKGWTETTLVESYMNNWSNASRNAYTNAIENARKSK